MGTDEAQTGKGEVKAVWGWGSGRRVRSKPGEVKEKAEKVMREKKRK